MQKVTATARDFPVGFAHQKPDAVAFSATEIIYHLVDVEELWQKRIGLLQRESIEVHSIEPDRLAKSGNYNVQVFSTGIESFVSARRHTFDIVRGLSPEQLQWTVKHPKFGELDVQKILEIMASHDLGHADQFQRTRTALGI